MANISHESTNKKRGLGRGLGSLLSPHASEEVKEHTLTDNVQLPSQNQNLTTQSMGGHNVTTQNESKMTIQNVDSHRLSSQNMSNQNMISQVVNTQNTGAQIAPEERIWIVGVEKLSPGGFQPRRTFDKDSLEELAQSIRENDILQPIVVRRTHSGKLEIIAGERRWRAAQIAGKHEVPVIIKSVPDKGALELAIVENIQRENLNPIEEAEAYERLISEFQLSQQEVAQKVGKDRVSVTNAIRLLALGGEIKELITSRQLSVGHAKVLLSLNDPQKRIYYARNVIADRLSVRQLEKQIKKDLHQANPKPTELSSPHATSMTAHLIEELSSEMQKILGTKVQIDYHNSKGKITIHYYTDEELTHIVEKLRSSCQI